MLQFSMPQVLIVVAILGTIALGTATTRVEAAPLVVTKAVTSGIASTAEPVFFFRCGLFGQRCRYKRDRR